jgi:transglutaminase-like putative cysteine protease
MTRRAHPHLAQEAALIAVHVVTALAFIRVFDDRSFAPTLVAYVLIAHALAIATRRARLPGAAAVAIGIAGAVLTTSWLLFSDTTRWGLPTGETWQAASRALQEAQELYPVVIAPTEAVPGFLLASGLALWTASWFADWTAHRLHAAAEALAPAFAIFVFCSILGSGQHEVASAVALAIAMLLFIALQRADSLQREQAWSPGRLPASRSIVRGAAATALVAVAAGAILGPALPGARSEAAVEWRGGSAGDRSRVTVSPMVELKKRLVEQSDTEVFRVEASQRSYWRLTSLDRFDGEIWSSNGNFSPADGRLPTSTPTDLPAAAITQTFEIDALAAIWAPVAFEAVSVRSADRDLRWDPDSSTLIVDSTSPTSDGMTYTVVSQAAAFEPSVLERSGRDDPSSLQERYEVLPDDFPTSVSTLASQVMGASASRYDQALALQDWFRDNFEYSLDSPAGHGDDALVDFLESGVGYCEQFAGAYAAMARSVGIPSRVAVGFTPGDADPNDPDLYVVRGRHAHAWPELYFPGTGWVPFEPTPGRGIPGAQEHTGVAEQQVAPGGGIEEQPSTTVPQSTTAAPTSSSPEAPVSTPQQTRTEGAPTPADEADTDRGPLILAIAGIGLVGAAAAWVIRGRRIAGRRFTDLTPADQAWERVVTALRNHLGVVADPAETPLELARRAQDSGGGTIDGLDRLAALVTQARWAPDPGVVRVDEVSDSAEQVLAALAATDQQVLEPA